MSNSDAHTALVNACLLELSKRGHLCWRNTTGEGWVGKVVRSFGGMITLTNFRHVTFGLPGSTDIIGIMIGGRALTVECKTGTGRLQKNQKGFRNAVEQRGGLHIEARSVEDMLGAIELAAITGDPGNEVAA